MPGENSTRIDEPADGDTRIPPSRKGARRRADIVEGALRLIGRDGLQGVSMRATAAEAAVPLGTVTYYFSDKEELIEAAFLTHTQRETARVVSALANLRAGLGPGDFAQQLATFVIDGLTGYRTQLLTEYRFLCESARRENLQRATAAWLQTLQAHLEEIVAGYSSSSPRTDAALILAVVAGLEVDNLSVAADGADEQTIRAVLARLLHGLHELWLREPASRHPARPSTGDRGPDRPAVVTPTV